MTARVVLFFACAAAFAQLPQPQAPPPRSEPSGRDRGRPEPSSTSVTRVDATVFDLQGQGVAGLTAADFALEADGKAQPIARCEYRTDQPLRLVVLLDDLSLTRERIDKARRSLREFMAKRLRPGDEAAILRTGSGVGSLDRFTSDPSALTAMIDRAPYNPAAEGPDAFDAGTLGALRGIVEGLRELPGRKAVLLISERLRDSKREIPDATARITSLAHRASIVLFAVDMGDAAEQRFVLEQGMAAAARDTGGQFLDRGDVAKALDGIAAQQAAYYVLTYGAEGLPFDFVGGTPRVARLAVKVKRTDVVVRARSGVFGSNDSYAEQGYRDPEREFQRAMGAEVIYGGVGAKLTGVISRGTTWQVEGVVHIDARDITFVKGLDGLYRTTLDTALALCGENGGTVKDISRTVDAVLSQEKYAMFAAHGFEYTLTVALPRAGPYQLRATVRDTASGRIGSARQFIRSADWSGHHLLMSTLLLRGEGEKKPDGSILVQDPDESGSVRSFRAGRQVHYSYWLYNVAVDAEKRSAVDVRAEVFRDGAVVLAGQPMRLPFTPAQDPERRAAAGVIRLSEAVPPGHYVLRVSVSDQSDGRTAAQLMDFDVRP
jgi:VWFA-related protein